MRAFALAILAVVAAFLVETLKLDPGARRVPLAVAVPLVVLALYEALGRRGIPPSSDVATPSRSTVRALVWVAALPVLAVTLGVQVGAPLFVLGFMRIHGREAWSAALTGAGLAAVGIAVLFGTLLGTSLPPGWLLHVLAAP